MRGMPWKVRLRLKAREGDFLELRDKVVFEIKGLVHPPGLNISFPRYILDEDGDRIRDGVRYKKIYPLKERYEYISATHPQFLIFDPVFNDYLCEVPDEDVAKHYEPTSKLAGLRTAKELSPIEDQALDLISLLKSKTNTSWENFGVSGSVLVDLDTPQSDIDVMVYGTEASRAVISALRVLRAAGESGVTPYSKKDLVGLYKRRVQDTMMPFEVFLFHESRKSFQGRFRGREFFVRFLKEWGEVGEAYGDILYEPRGYAKIRAIVVDADDAIFTPCKYGVRQTEIVAGDKNLNIVAVSSFRGRFCEHAEVGEQIEAQGKVEEVTAKSRRYQRILVGGKPTDYVAKVSLSRL